MSTMPLNLGAQQSAFEQALKRAADEQLVDRIWQHDHTVWAPDPDEISNRLGWLDIADRMRGEIPDLQDFARAVIADGIDKVLVLGMGGSSLAPEVLSHMLGAAPGHPTLEILDSTDPEVLRDYTRRFPAKETLYIVSTKSGGTVETLSFFKHFYNQAVQALGPDAAGAHFAAITDPGSKLVDLAGKFDFRRTFLNDPNIGGRYSALSMVGLVPAALLGIDLEQLLGHAIAMAKQCQADEADNPGIQLGLGLAVLANAGRDKATFLAPEALQPFGNWVEQLIAESTGKSGTGILPVVGEPATDNYGGDRVFISLGDAAPAPGVPSLELAWPEEYELGAQFFLWEFATAVAGYGLGIHPFNQPNVEAAKVQARQMTQQYIDSGELPAGEDQAASAEALATFLDQGTAGDYIALQAYLPATAANAEALEGLRAGLLERYGYATTLGFGPRFLHSTGQLHKGDGGNGLFVQLVTPPPDDDVPIPLEAGAAQSEISFGVLKAAQALGDAQALRGVGRRVLTFSIHDPVDEIKTLAEGIHG